MWNSISKIYHHVVLLARNSPNSLTPSIASSRRSSRRHPVFVSSCSSWSFYTHAYHPFSFLPFFNLYLPFHQFLSPQLFIHFSSLFSASIYCCRIHQLHLCRGVRPTPQMSVLIMTLNNMMFRFKQYWSFGKFGAPLQCQCSQVHSGPEW